jgi:hypothetical protein
MMKRVRFLLALFTGAVGVLSGLPVSQAQDDKPSINRRIKLHPDVPAKNGSDQEKASSEEAPSSSKSKRGETTIDPEQFLTEKELTRDNRKFLLDESQALEKYHEAKDLFAKFQDAMGKYYEIAGFDETVANLTFQSQAMQQQADALQQQINNVSANASRMRMSANAQLNVMRQQHSQWVSQANQLRSERDALQGKAPTQAQRESVVTELDAARQAYIDGVNAMSEKVTPLMEQYQDLAHDLDVTDALAQLRKKTTLNYKLGPSDDLRAAAKVIKDLKLNTAPPGKPKSSKKKAASRSGS